jgi:hypothetical protein
LLSAHNHRSRGMMKKQLSLSVLAKDLSVVYLSIQKFFTVCVAVIALG